MYKTCETKFRQSLFSNFNLLNACCILFALVGGKVNNLFAGNVFSNCYFLEKMMQTLTVELFKKVSVCGKRDDLSKLHMIAALETFVVFSKLKL